MTVFRGHVEWTQRVNVEIDAEKFCSTYAVERAEFDGSDEEFLNDSLHIMAYDIFHENNPPPVDDGMVLTADGGDFEVYLREKRQASA